MKPLLSIGLILIYAGLSAQYNSKNLKMESSASAGQYQFENLQLYPIRANQDFVNHHKSLGNYVTLNEALVKGKIEITEYSRGTVNTLLIENISADTIMILSGEVVQVVRT